MVVLNVKPGQKIEYQSEDFKNITSGQYQIIKADPRGMKFVQTKTQQALVSPAIKDIGQHIIRLFGFSKDGGKYLQEVMINVPEIDNYKEVHGKIVKITRGGTIKI